MADVKFCYFIYKGLYLEHAGALLSIVQHTENEMLHMAAANEKELESRSIDIPVRRPAHDGSRDSPRGALHNSISASNLVVDVLAFRRMRDPGTCVERGPLGATGGS